MKYPLISGLVLAGGKSRRMGHDKASLVYGDRKKSQAIYTCELLEPLCDSVYLSVRKGQSIGQNDWSRFATVEDQWDDLGPLGGILSAFHFHPEHAWLVVACDLPLLSSACLEHLVKNRALAQGATAYGSTYDGLPEPLCAIYEPTFKTTLVNSRKKNCLCPRKILINSGISLLAPFEDGSLDNANTPGEYELHQKVLIDQTNQSCSR